MNGESKGLWEPDGLGVGVEKDFTNPCQGSVGVRQVRKRDRASEARGTLCPKGGGVTGKGGYGGKLFTLSFRWNGGCRLERRAAVTPRMQCPFGGMEDAGWRGGQPKLPGRSDLGAKRACKSVWSDVRGSLKVGHRTLPSARLVSIKHLHEPREACLSDVPVATPP